MSKINKFDISKKNIVYMCWSQKKNRSIHVARAPLAFSAICMSTLENSIWTRLTSLIFLSKFVFFLYCFLACISSGIGRCVCYLAHWLLRIANVYIGLHMYLERTGRCVGSGRRLSYPGHWPRERPIDSSSSTWRNGQHQWSVQFP